MNDETQPTGFDWASLVARSLHPVEVQIIEAMQWLDQPLSASDLSQLFDEAVPWALLCRHLRRLTKLGAIELAEPATGRNISSVTSKDSGKEESMPPTKPPYPPEFRREAVQLARTSERSIARLP